MVQDEGDKFGDPRTKPQFWQEKLEEAAENIKDLDDLPNEDDH